jgi:hypothetical protein
MRKEEKTRELDGELTEKLELGKSKDGIEDLFEQTKPIEISEMPKIEPQNSVIESVQLRSVISE